MNDCDVGMSLFHDFDKIERDVKPSVVTIGSFDGVHKGHRLLIWKMNTYAKFHNLRSIVVTFDPHPREVLRGENRLLSTIEERITLFMEAGVQNLLTVNFTKKFSQIPYDKFIQEYVIAKLGAKAIFIGDGHHFGHQREGTQQTLQDMGLDVQYIPRLDNISSTAIRQAIDGDDMPKAVEMLGAKYMIINPVTNPTKIIPKTINEQYIRYITIKMQ